MPVVPPTVSATTGALLLPHVPDGALRTAFAALCWTLLLLSVAGTLRVLALLARRVRAHGFGDPATAPAWFIVLGPLGQSVTAVHHLGGPVGWVGPPVVVAALAWAVVATVVVLRARPRFGLTWWSFTFPVATLVTATAGLGWGVVSAGLTGVLVVAFVVVAAGTVRGVCDGSLR